MRRRGGLLFFVGIFVFLSFAYAQDQNQDPQIYKTQADNNARVAQELSDQARQLVEGPLSREKLETAIRLYVRAGELFERAGKTYQALGPSFAAKEDVENSFKSMQSCLDNIKEIRKRL